MNHELYKNIGSCLINTGNQRLSKSLSIGWYSSYYPPYDTEWEIRADGVCLDGTNLDDDDGNEILKHLTEILKQKENELAEMKIREEDSVLSRFKSWLKEKSCE